MSPAEVPARREADRSPKWVEYLGYRIAALTMEETVAVIRGMIGSGQPHVHACINAAKMVAMRTDANLAEAVRAADLVSADGQSVVWSARALAIRLPERVAGIDLMERLLQEAQTEGLSIFLLGSTESVLRDLVTALELRFPTLLIVGAHHGYFGAATEGQVVELIRKARPKLLFLGMGSPRKEIWLAANRDRLGVPFSMGVGGSFDVLAGHRRRAPTWARGAGLEWVFRFAQEPKRMWKRYLVGNAVFLSLVLRAVWQRLASSGPAGDMRSRP